MSAMAGETILIAGEYKNAGWLWGARIINGQAGSFRLIPANYIEYLPEHLPAPPQTRSIHTAVSSLSTQSTASAQQPAHFPQGEAAHKGRPSSSAPEPTETQRDAAALAHHTHPTSHAHLPQHLLSASAPGVGLLQPPNQTAVLGSSAPVPAIAAAAAAEAHRDRERPPAEAWDGGGDGGDGGAGAVVGDPDDPFLDGMYEDENGQASVCC